APLREAAARLGRAAELLAPFPALGTQAAAMRARAERLAHSRFTIALFGAFSAGKSSLANALIGEPVLPVSPNPTTAAINRIVPPAESFPHGTARVVMKTREAMLSDLRYSLALLGEEVDGVDEAGLLRRIASLSPEAVRAGARPHYSFLKAAHQGWEENAPLLGRELAADREQYRRFVAEESRSCFVREIELHYRCPMTDQGIVLVDTPGADSVNARHTDVAFNYIKNADAVLFVTYYNHAFSQADRQFLTQLGRVKDQFELDKMFFLVNAADLAASAEELQGVLAHVERNLLEHGIRFPRLFPVSSLEALDAKLAGDRERLARSGLAAFEDAFIGFTRGELGQVALSAAEQELERTRSTIADWLAAAEGDAATREAERRRWRSLASFAARRAAELAVEPVPSRMADELRELLFYVLQRIRFRFGDFYNLAFNPSALQDDGRDMRKTLWLAWLELQRLLQTELSQELLATSLRMEKTVTALCGEAYGRAAGELAAELSGYAPAPYAPEELPTPEPPADWTTDAVEAKWLWSRFKSPRHFFEGDGKAALRQELEKLLAEPLQSWSSAREAEWKELYAGHWERLCAAASARLKEDAAAFVEGKIASLEDGADPQSLRKLRDDLAKL
ncbi:dynamin family protein, partial [Paenibacillus cisolokensis]|uniref:dynamin family protein n=1 Tax=Paenibacillus cisolokensis TaxID=1658519 RepID=UPI003D2E41D0